MCGNYRGRCIGRVLHFLCEYGFPWYDETMFDGRGNITLRGRLYAEYTWDQDTDIPTFKFHGEGADFREEVQRREKEQVVKMDQMYDIMYKREPWKLETSK
jgi:hypothetical protein